MTAPKFPLPESNVLEETSIKKALENKIHVQGRAPGSLNDPNRGEESPAPTSGRSIRLLPAPTTKTFPLNMVILSLLFVSSLVVFSVYHHAKIVTYLPDKYKPLFLKAVGPFINAYEGRVGRPADATAEAKTPGAAKRLVQIRGHYYEYNPDGVYVVDGERVFFKDQLKR